VHLLVKEILMISLPYSQAPATCVYPEPDQSSPCLPIPILEDNLHDIKFWTITVLTIRQFKELKSDIRWTLLSFRILRRG